MSTAPAALDLDHLRDADRYPLSRLIEAALDDLASDLEDAPSPRRIRSRAGLYVDQAIAQVGFALLPINLPGPLPGYRIVATVGPDLLVDDDGKLHTADAAYEHVAETIAKLRDGLVREVDHAIDVALTDTSDSQLRRDHPREL
jgi:hypothetical protein